MTYIAEGREVEIGEDDDYVFSLPIGYIGFWVKDSRRYPLEHHGGFIAKTK